MLGEAPRLLEIQGGKVPFLFELEKRAQSLSELNCGVFRYLSETNRPKILPLDFKVSYSFISFSLIVHRIRKEEEVSETALLPTQFLIDCLLICRSTPESCIEMNTEYGTLSDAQIAYLLQQEEFGNLPITHLVLPHVPPSSASHPPKCPSKPTDDASVILLDDSDEDYMPTLDVKESIRLGANDDTLGVLDAHELFVKYNDMYFEGRLDAVSVEWSNRMTLCAGLCSWKRNGDCRIKLSSKLLQYRSNKELKETLLVCYGIHASTAQSEHIEANNRHRSGFQARVHPRLPLPHSQQQRYVTFLCSPLTNPI